MYTARFRALWKRHGISLTALAAALLFFAVSAQHIAARSPYPSHPDEPFILDSAWEIAKSGNLNPNFFNYGSLPIYVSALSLRAAAQVALLRGKIHDLAEVEPVSFPYYAQPAVSNTPRVVFALFGFAALLAVALIGRSFAQRAEVVLVPSLALMANADFQAQAMIYVNVDILATALATLALAYLVHRLERHDLWARCLVPALFCGAAIATKYNAGLLMLPFGAAILRSTFWSHADARASTLRAKALRALGQLSLFACATALVFLLCEPYAALDFPNFWAAAMAEREHYRTGHAGHDGEPGLAQALFYARTIYGQLGPILSCLMLLGVAYGLRVRRSATLLLLLFPLSSLAFMSAQRVHFVRNILPSVAVLTAFTGLGTFALSRLLERLLSAVLKRPAPRSLGPNVRAWLVRSGVVALMLGSMVVLAQARPSGNFELTKPESRSKLARWLRKHAGPGCLLIAPVQLALNPGSIPAQCSLQTFTTTEQEPAEVASSLAPLRARAETYIVVPRWGLAGDAVPPPSPDAWNALPELLNVGRPLMRVGSVKVRLNRHRVGGDPQLSLYRFEPEETP